MIKVIDIVAVAVEPDITPYDPFGVDELALVGIKIVQVLTGAQPGRIVIVVVEHGMDVGNEIRIIGDLNNNVEINPGLLMIVPHQEGENFVPGLEVNRDTLQGGPQ